MSELIGACWNILVLPVHLDKNEKTFFGIDILIDILGKAQMFEMVVPLSFFSQP